MNTCVITARTKRKFFLALLLTETRETSEATLPGVETRYYKTVRHLMMQGSLILFAPLTSLSNVQTSTITMIG